MQTTQVIDRLPTMQFMEDSRKALAVEHGDDDKVRGGKQTSGVQLRMFVVGLVVGNSAVPHFASDPSVGKSAQRENSFVYFRTV